MRKVYIVVYDNRPHMSRFYIFNILEVVETDEMNYSDTASQVMAKYYQMNMPAGIVAFFKTPEDVLKQYVKPQTDPYMKDDAW